MRLSGKLIKGTSILYEAAAEENSEEMTYTERLEKCLVALCRELDIPVPLWLNKNTKEYSRFRRTFFFEGQFTEKVGFDRFEIMQLKD